MMDDAVSGAVLVGDHDSSIWIFRDFGGWSGFSGYYPVFAHSTAWSRGIL